MGETIARTYRFKPATIKRLEQLAKEQDAWPGQLLEKLLERALNEVETGQWKLRRLPIKYRVQIE